MSSNQVLAQPEAMRPKAISLIAGAAAIVAAAFVLFTNPATTARRANALSGSGEVMSGAMAAPGAGQAPRDRSVPDAAESFESAHADSALALSAPTF